MSSAASALGDFWFSDVGCVTEPGGTVWRAGECLPRGACGRMGGAGCSRSGQQGRKCTEVELDGAEAAPLRGVSRLHGKWGIQSVNVDYTFLMSPDLSLGGTGTPESQVII